MSTRTNCHCLCIAAMVSLTGTHLCLAQCDPDWKPFDPTSATYPGTDGVVQALHVWDQDGPGPSPAKLIVAGDFTIAANTLAANIAAFDLDSKSASPLGLGLTVGTGPIYALATLNNGDLVAGGSITSAGGTPAKNIAQWDGANWTPLGEGVGNFVRALAVTPNGDLIAGGLFLSAGGQPANHIAKWDGAAWSPLGTGTNLKVDALVILPNGDLIAGGEFTTAGSTPASRIARWNGTTWSPLAEGLSAGVLKPEVMSLAVLANGDLVAGGNFGVAGTVAAKNVARWNSTTWSAMGAGFSGPFLDPYVNSLLAVPNGNVMAAGGFVQSGAAFVEFVAEWNGAEWIPVGEGFNWTANTLTQMPSGAIICGGGFDQSDDIGIGNVAAWDGQVWTGATPPGFDNSVISLSADASGSLTVAGGFKCSPDAGGSNVVEWNGQEWLDVTPGPSITIQGPLARRSDGTLLAVAEVQGAGFKPQVIQRQGSTWTLLGDKFSSDINAIEVTGGDDVIAAGKFLGIGTLTAIRIARWDGSTWHPMADGFNKDVNAIATSPSGDVFAGGQFTQSGSTPINRVARWDGAVWMGIGDGFLGEVLCLTLDSNGYLIAGGYFNEIVNGVRLQRIARWDGTAWNALSDGLTGVPYDLLSTPSGLVAAGNFSFAGSTPANRIARWDGSAWHAIGSGIDGTVRAIDLLSNGDLVAGGSFHSVHGVVAPYIARFECFVKVCYADCDASGSLDIDDFVCFQTLYAIASPAADCDASGSLDIDDFICFQTLYAIGC